MKRMALIALLLLLACAPARAETDEEAIAALPLGGLEAFAREAGLTLDVRGLVGRLASGGAAEEAGTLLETLRLAFLQAMRDALPSLSALLAPALLWALGRQLTGGGRLGAANGLVCCLAEATLLSAVFSGQMDMARQAIGRVAALIERFHPVMSALLSAAGAPATAGLMAPSGALAAAIITRVMTGAVFSLSAAAAMLTAAGCLSERVKLDGLFRLCRDAANWLMGGATTLFLGLMTAGGLLEGGRDSVTLRAAEYAVDNLLPVIGGDVADTLGAAAGSVALLRRAVGVTGTALLAGLCAAPMARLTAAVLCCRLAGALAEAASDGPAARCLRGFADAMQLLLVAMAACAALFLVIAGAGIRGAGALGL